MLNDWNYEITKPSIMLWFSGSHIHRRIRLPKDEYSSGYELGPDVGIGAYVNSNITNSHVITKNTNSITLYNNGQEITKNEDSNTLNRLNISNISFTIGRWHNSNGYYSNQNVYAMRVYNRALTEDEIRQNYEIDKVRFNIQD